MSHPCLGNATLVALMTLGSILEQSYGITRIATLSTVDPDCVGRVLRGTEGITEVEELYRDGGPLVPLRAFHYRGAGFRIWLALRRLKEGGIEFEHDSTNINRRPSDDEIEVTIRMMVKVEERLVKECGMKELARGVKEKCEGVECPGR